MSFGIQVAGRPAAVIKAIQNHPGYGDTSQLDAVKAFLCSELQSIPADNGVYVTANGHHSDNTRQLTIEIKMLTLAEDLPAPA